jgi:hypothetical protein
VDSNNSTASSTDEKEKPKGFWSRVLVAIPVVLALVATAFAGMSSSEMTKSMYFRSLAGQHQSKAGDQWAFFQAKRIRGTNLETTEILLQTIGNSLSYEPLEDLPAKLDYLASIIEEIAKGQKDKKADFEKALQKTNGVVVKLKKMLSDEKTKQNLTYLATGTLPKIEDKKLKNAEVQKAIDDVIKEVGDRKTESDTAESVRKLNAADIDEAIRVAEQNADSFSKSCDPVTDTIKEFRNIFRELESALKLALNGPPDKQTVADFSSLKSSFMASVLNFDARRYREESNYNRKAAELYEVRVRRSGVESDIHRERSFMFFYCMLIAQAGVVIGSLAAGRSLRGLLLFSLFFGVASIGFGGYVSFTLK